MGKWTTRCHGKMTNWLSQGNGLTGYPGEIDNWISCGIEQLAFKGKWTTGKAEERKPNDWLLGQNGLTGYHRKWNNRISWEYGLTGYHREIDNWLWGKRKPKKCDY